MLWAAFIYHSDDSCARRRRVHDAIGLFTGRARADKLFNISVMGLTCFLNLAAHSPIWIMNDFSLLAVVTYG